MRWSPLSLRGPERASEPPDSPVRPEPAPPGPSPPPRQSPSPSGVVVVPVVVGATVVDVLDIAAQRRSVNHFIGFLYLYLYFVLCFFVEVVNVITTIAITVKREQRHRAHIEDTDGSRLHRPGPLNAKPGVAKCFSPLTPSTPSPDSGATPSASSSAGSYRGDDPGPTHASSNASTPDGTSNDPATATGPNRTAYPKRQWRSN